MITNLSATELDNYYSQQKRGGGIVPGSTNSRYFDAASNIEVLIGAGAGNDQRVQYLFGGDSADVLEGKGFDAAAATKGVVLGGGTKSDSFLGSAYSDVITTGGGSSNYVNAYAGDDMVVGGDGRDFIRRGANALGANQTDNGIAFGAANSDILLGGAGNDLLWGEYDNADNITTSPDSAERGDWLSGESGGDTLTGSRRSDVLFGGAGADLMLGDAQYTPFSKATSLPYAETVTQSFAWSDTQPGNHCMHELSEVAINSGATCAYLTKTTRRFDFKRQAVNHTSWRSAA